MSKKGTKKHKKFYSKKRYKKWLKDSNLQEEDLEKYLKKD